jgi:hypothetical protein
MATEPERSILANGVKLIGEVAVLPGSGLLLEGQVVSGLLHTGSAYVAGAILGPIGWFLVVADSYSRSVTGRHLWEQRAFASSDDDKHSAPAPASAPGTSMM